MKVVVGGNTIEIKPRDVLGSGGEGLVARLPDPNRVVKVYHQPEARRARKIEAFLRGGFNWPANVLAPLAEARDPRTQQIVGFVMAAAKGGEELYALGNRDYRQKHGITIRDALKVSVHAKATLDAVHRLGVVVGDLNDLGIQFNQRRETVWFDVDSFQIPGFPCIVAMESFLDPRLYDKAFNDGSAYFSVESDLYAFAVILFKSLFLVHPYGGNHVKLKDVPSRARAKVDVFHPDVRLPRWASPPQIVGDDLLQIFHRYFAKGERPAIPLALLEQQLASLRDCPNCGAVFSGTRQTCPACAEKVVALPGTRPTDKVIGVDNVEYVEWFQTQGEVLYFQALGSNEYAWVVREAGSVELYRWRSGRVVKKTRVHDQHIHGFSFAVTRNLLVVGKGEEIALFATDGNRARELRRLKTSTFGGRPVFATSAEGVYRMLGLQVFLSKEGDLLKDRLMETQTLTAAEDQTWLQVSPAGTVAGFVRFFNETRWFLRSKKGHFSLMVTPVQARARLVSSSVRFDDERGTLLVLRRAIHADGSEHCYLDALSSADGTLVRSYEEDANRSDNLKDIHGRALLGQSVFHPTDRGLVLEIDRTKIKEFPATTSFIDARDRLVPHADGVLVVGEKRIGHLRVVNH